MEKKEINLLVKLISNGDAEAFDKLYRNIYKPLFRYIYGLVPDSAAVKDILQNTFLTVIEKCKEKIIFVNCFSWIFTIAHNLSVNYIRKNVREVSSYSLENQDVTPQSDTDGKIQLRIAVKKLDAEEKAIIRLKYLNDFTYKDLAHIYRTSQTSMKRRVGKIINKLQDEII